MSESEGVSRRDFLKTVLLAAGVTITAPLPDWVEIEDEEEFQSLVEICEKVLDKDQLADLLDTDDFQEALGLVWSFLLDQDIDPYDYLVMQNYLQ